MKITEEALCFEIYFYFQALAATPPQPKLSFSRFTTQMVTILSNCVSTNTLTKPCIAVPVMDRRSGAILVCTTFTHQTMLGISKLLSPTVVLLTLSPRGTQLVIVHFLPEKATSLRLILKCFTRQRLEAQIILAYFKFLVSGATEKAGVRRVGSGRENWRERPCFVLFFLPGRSH